MSDAQHHSKITKKIAEGIGEFPDPFFLFFISVSGSSGWSELGSGAGLRKDYKFSPCLSAFDHDQRSPSGNAI